MISNEDEKIVFAPCREQGILFTSKKPYFRQFLPEYFKSQNDSNSNRLSSERLKMFAIMYQIQRERISVLHRRAVDRNYKESQSHHKQYQVELADTVSALLCFVVLL